METDIYKFAEKIETKQDFDFFMELLIKDLLKNGQDWENNTLNEYLQSMRSYSLDIDNNSLLTWKYVAELFLAAKIYE